MKTTMKYRVANALSSLLIVVFWRFAAWVCTYIPGNTTTEDQWFMVLVAMTLALHLHKVDRT